MENETEIDGINDLWETFRTAVIPDASDVQRIEMKKAFYAGGGAVLVLLLAIAGMDEDEGAAKLTELHEEANAFFAPGGGAWENPFN